MVAVEGVQSRGRVEEPLVDAGVGQEAPRLARVERKPPTRGTLQRVPTVWRLCSSLPLELWQLRGAIGALRTGCLQFLCPQSSNPGKVRHAVHAASGVRQSGCVGSRSFGRGLDHHGLALPPQLRDHLLDDGGAPVGSAEVAQKRQGLHPQLPLLIRNVLSELAGLDIEHLDKARLDATRAPVGHHFVRMGVRRRRWVGPIHCSFRLPLRRVKQLGGRRAGGLADDLEPLLHADGREVAMRRAQEALLRLQRGQRRRGLEMPLVIPTTPLVLLIENGAF
eukprot:scaffold4850_cov213-Pinguiococcus_pyrenoidosus.AAC.10